MTRLHRILLPVAVALFAAGPALAVNTSGRYRLVPGTGPDSESWGVADRETGLTWQRLVTSESFGWAEARHHCVELRFGGHADWRLPTIRELKSIVDVGVSNPSIDTLNFPSTPQIHFWSSSPVASDATKAWAVIFDNGGTVGVAKTSLFRVRCVR